jgi:DNA-directed RNA polymerase subunit RPC12/RpoP
MSKPIVRCRCGHQVLAKEVLRTDLYERRASEGSSREYVYVKYRCQRCKRMGEAFVPESRWDRSILEPAQNEMNDRERDQFLDESPISDDEVLDFHKCLQAIANLNHLNGSPGVASVDATPEIKETSAEAAKVGHNGVTTPPPAAQVTPETPPQTAAVQSPALQAPSVQPSAAHGTKASSPENTPSNQSSAGCPPEEPHSKVFRGDTQ